MWNRIRSWLQAMFQRSRLEREMDAELRFHVETYTEDLIRTGAPRPEAARCALIEFGGIQQAKEQCRDARGLEFIDTFSQDLRYGLRMLCKSPGFTSVAVLSLALGIGANTAIFTLLDALLLRSLPVPSPQQLVRLSPSRPDGTVLFSFPMFREVEHGQRVFSGLIAWSPGWMVNVEVKGTLAQDNVQAVTGNYYSVLGVNPFLGRLITPQDADPSSGSPSQVAVLGYEFWHRLGAPSDLVGKQIRIEGQPFTPSQS
jgi:hypothetical protein